MINFNKSNKNYLNLTEKVNVADVTNQKSKVFQIGLNLASLTALPTYSQLMISTNKEEKLYLTNME